MADTKGSTMEKSKGVTSPITASRQASNVRQNTQTGVKPPTPERDEVITTLARLLDVMNSWPCKADGKMPKPLITAGHVMVALPLGGHVIRNSVTSEGKMNFVVDDVTVIPE